ncbi:hypothetical protein GCM10027259_51170 [Micromonospora palomenae]
MDEGGDRIGLGRDGGAEEGERGDAGEGEGAQGCAGHGNSARWGIVPVHCPARREVPPDVQTWKIIAGERIWLRWTMEVMDVDMTM